MSDEDEVGYKKPPKHARFKPGESGNPRGRPKKSANVGLEIVKELSQKVSVRENGVERKLTKSAALAKSLVSRALGGDIRASGLLMRLLPTQFQPPQDRSAVTKPLNSEESAALERFVARRLAESRRETTQPTPASPLPEGGGEDQN